MEEFLDQSLLAFTTALALALMHLLHMSLRLFRPLAAAHLRHYLTARGRSLRVDLQHHLAADPGTRAALLTEIRRQRNAGSSASFDMVGHARIPLASLTHESASPRRYTKLYL